MRGGGVIGDRRHGLAIPVVLPGIAMISTLAAQMGRFS
jgi:hypothetical protein